MSDSLSGHEPEAKLLYLLKNNIDIRLYQYFTIIDLEAICVVKAKMNKGSNLLKPLSLLSGS
jgi:hypothetical protein